MRNYLMTGLAAAGLLLAGCGPNGEGGVDGADERAYDTDVGTEGTGYQGAEDMALPTVRDTNVTYTAPGATGVQTNDTETSEAVGGGTTAAGTNTGAGQQGSGYPPGLTGGGTTNQ